MLVEIIELSAEFVAIPEQRHALRGAGEKLLVVDRSRVEVTHVVAEEKQREVRAVVREPEQRDIGRGVQETAAFRRDAGAQDVVVITEPRAEACGNIPGGVGRGGGGAESENESNDQRNAYGVLMASTDSRVPSVDPSIATITSYSWGASA